MSHPRGLRRPAAVGLTAAALLIGGCSGAADGPLAVQEDAAAPAAPQPPQQAAGDGKVASPVQQAAAAGSATTDVPWTPGVFEPPPQDVAPWGVWIPRLEVEASLQELGLEPDGELQVPEQAEVAGWYVGGPRPGEVGPTVIAGHVDSRTGPAVFARLAELQVDDLVHVVYRSGFVTTWRVTGVEQHPKGRFPTDRVYGELAGPGLRLITCGGDFDRSAGHYDDNVVVFAEPYATWAYDPGV